MVRTAKVYLVGAGPGDPELLTQKALRILQLSDVVICDRLYANSTQTIVRLKSGDPMAFGRGGEELDFLARNGIEAEVVPGVSSALAAPSSAGIPLTFRGLAAAFAVVAGHRQSLTSLDWSAYRFINTLVILIGEGRYEDTPIAFIEHATTHRERVIESTPGKVSRRMVDAEAPAMPVVGEVVGLRKRLHIGLCAGAAA